MRIEKVVAHAFGPLRGEELNFAPGMTVVSGPNEAGKSSWHAALRLAVTGLRRGKGPGTAAERQLAERHRPWDGSETWAVEARLRLADGRIIEISQDLAGKVDCRAVDVGLGRDVSHEILDGTPDASRWLGLTRDAFAATISVSQAQILAVTEAADELQGQMQRAAATRGTDATAAEAIAALEQFRRDAVGVDRVGARGPLRRAKERLAALETRLAETRRQHDEYLERSADVDLAEARVAEARRSALSAEAQLAAERAAVARRRHREAAELASRHPTRPEALALRDERADEVAAAIEAWEARPELMTLTGPTAADLEAQLATLPDEPPIGDLEPHASVLDALRALELADDAHASLAAEPDVEDPGLPAIEEARIRELARRLRAPRLANADLLERELGAAREGVERARATLARPLLVAGAGLLLVGLGLLAAGQTAIALVLVALSGVAGAGGWVAGGRARLAAARLARAEAAVAPYRDARRAAEADRATADAEARAANLPVEPEALDELADRIASAAAARRAGMGRQARLQGLGERSRLAAERLLAALAARGAEAGPDARAAWYAYQAECRERRGQAEGAARRQALAREVAGRRSAERAARAADAALVATERRLRATASAVGLASDQGPDELVAALRGWQRQRGEELGRNEAAIADWQRLQALLDDTSLEQLEERAQTLEAAAGRLAAELGQPPRLDELPLAELEARVAREKEKLLAEASARDALRGNLEARRETLPDVAEAEESVLGAKAELRRVQALAETLDRTLALLRAAEERVHRSLAPILAATVERWLPSVCQGAYAQATVDPADLSVRVKEAATGRWRDARLLSEGTREQVYLLLRVAMAEHLVINGETAPLLLDEVTVQSDAARKRELLGVLHRLSGERQVILFTHDDEVLAWAERHLDGARDTSIVLPRRPRGATGEPVESNAEAPVG